MPVVLPNENSKLNNPNHLTQHRVIIASDDAKAQTIAIQDDSKTRIGDGGGNDYMEVQSDGQIHMVGKSRIYQYQWLGAEVIRAAGIKPATFTLNDNGFCIFSFADGAEQQIQFNMQIPPTLDYSQPVQICVGWSSPSNTGVCDWELTYLITKIGDSTEQAGTTVNNNYLPSTTTNGLLLTPVLTIPGDTLTSNDLCFHAFLQRDGDDVGDTLGDVAEIHGLAMKYVANKLGTGI